jgi:hypothetical protein
MGRAAIGALQSVLVIILVVLGTTSAFAIRGAPHHDALQSPLRFAPIVTPLQRYAVSAPLRAIKVAPAKGETKRVIPHRGGPTLPNGKPNGLKAAIQPQVAPRMPATSNAFDGLGNGFTGPQGTFTVNAVPPDPNGAVGPQDYVQTVNESLAVFNKDPSRGAVGSVRLGPVPINALWSGAGGLCETDNDGDPIVVYDSIANRWVISQFAVTNATTATYECIAISTGSDPTGTYYRYVASYSNVFIDYPKMALWPDAYYMTYNLFQIAAPQGFLGAMACAFDRAAMLNGGVANQVCFPPNTNDASLLPSTLDGSRLPPGGSPNYLVELGTSTSLNLWKFHVDFVTPNNSTLTGPFSIPVASYLRPCNGSGGTCIPQPAPGSQLDSLGDRLMYRLAYRNFGTYESLVVDHAIAINGVVGMRWYEIRTPSGTPTLYQQGTVAPADSRYRWMGSIAEDGVGNMAMGYSLSSSTVIPSIGYTGRLASDALGSMAQGETILQQGTGVQTNQSRWGDYTSMAVDPVNDCTFWYTNAYLPANGSFNWKTRIGSFTFPSCVGTELIQNGGFESGATSWTQSSFSGQQTIYSSTQAHAGAQAYFPCGYRACDDRVSQAITVPATVNSAKLKVWLRSFSSLGALPGAPCVDHFYATLATLDGTAISGGTIAPLCETDAVGGYVLETFDVTSLLQAHAGQQLIVMLRGTTANLAGDSGTITHWGVDDVSLLVF